MFPIENKIYVKIEDHWFDLTEYNTHPGGTEILKISFKRCNKRF